MDHVSSACRYLFREERSDMPVRETPAYFERRLRSKLGVKDKIIFSLIDFADRMGGR